MVCLERVVREVVFDKLTLEERPYDEGACCVNLISSCGRKMSGGEKDMLGMLEEPMRDQCVWSRVHGGRERGDGVGGKQR